jgi:putative membrane protein
MPLSSVADCPSQKRRLPYFLRKPILWLCAIAMILGLLAEWSWIQFTREGIIWYSRMFNPVIIILAAALVCVTYAIGVARGATSTFPQRRWRHAAFAVGIGTVLLALEAPLGTLARQLFLARQLQDLLLGVIAPILIVLAMPRRALIAGISGESPSNASPFEADDTELEADSFWRNAAATALAIGVLYVWLYPPFQNATVTSSLIELALNGMTFGAALLFWGFIFDFRPLPAGAGYGSRLMMLWIMSLSHIAVGAYLTIKTEVLYSAYGTAGRLFGISSLTDETTGGFIIWVPSALLCLAAIIMVIHLWGRHEDRIWAKYSGWSSSNSAALLFPTTGEQLITLARPKNRAMAIAVMSFVIGVFGFTIFGGILNHINNGRHTVTRGPLSGKHLAAHSMTGQSME